MEDGARVEQGLGSPEDVFDHPEVFIFQHDLCGGERGVGAQCPHFVNLFLLLCLFVVDGEGTLAGLEIAPVSLVGDQALGTAAELALKCGE